MGDRTRRSLPPGLLGGALFFAVVLLGSGYIVYSKLYELSAIYVTAVPVVVMVGYALLLGIARLFRLRDDQSGDNLYYMGFLFTLTSLAVSLYQFRSAGSAEPIVQNFGIAIASTIAGITLRIIFNQMRRDPVEVEATARLELAEAARKIKRELESTVLEFSYFRRMAQQSVGDILDETKELLVDARDELAKDLREFGSTANKPIEEASLRTAAALDNLSKKITRTLDPVSDRLIHDTEQLSTSTRGVATTLDQIAQKLAAMQTPEQVIEIKLTPMVQGLTRAVNAFNKAIESREAMNEEHKQAIEALTAALKELSKAFEVSGVESGVRPPVAPWERER